MNDPLMTTKDLAIFLGKSPGAIRVQLHRTPEELPRPFYLGKQLRWDPRDVKAWIEAKKKEGGPGTEPGPQSRETSTDDDDARLSG